MIRLTLYSFGSQATDIKYHSHKMLFFEIPFLFFKVHENSEYVQKNKLQRSKSKYFQKLSPDKVTGLSSFCLSVFSNCSAVDMYF